MDTPMKYREIIKENIQYDVLLEDGACSPGRLDEIVDLMADTICSAKPVICIAGDDYPAALVKDKLLRLNSLHIQYVLDSMDKSVADIRNIKNTCWRRFSMHPAQWAAITKSRQTVIDMAVINSVKQ